MNRELFTRDLLASFPGIGWMRRITKVLSWLVLGGFGFVILVNFFDEDLHPEVAAYRKIEKPALADESNAYYAVAGLAAPIDQDAHAAGRRLIAQLENAEARKFKGETPSWPEVFRTNLLVRRGLAVLSICEPARNSCTGWVSQNHREASQLVSSNQLLLARYRALHDYPSYAEIRAAHFWDEPFVHSGPLLQVQRIFFVQTALQLQRGDVDAALSGLGKDIAFSRKALAGSRTVWTKASMNQQLANSALLLSELLAQRRTEIGSRATAFEEVLRPLQADERRLAAGLQAHFVAHATTVERIFDNQKWEERLAGHIIKPNATINRAFRAYKIQSDADAVPAAQYVAQLSTVQAALPTSPDWTSFYNPFGKMVSDMSRFDDRWAEYQYQMYDLDALLRLVALQAQVVARQLPDSDVPRFASADARYHDPYTNQPMSWDEKTARLCYEPQSRRYGNAKAPVTPCCSGPMAGKAGPMCVRLSPAAA